jgi:hypothetical protein
MEETFDQWHARQIMEYRKQRAEEDDFELALKGNYSIDNIKRVVKERLYSKSKIMNSNPWDYDENRAIKTLLRLKDRYFRPVIAYPDGHLTHHGNCEIHRAMDIYRYAFCSCGFLHDLDFIPESIALKLWPTFYDEIAKQDAIVPGSNYWGEKPTKEQIEKNKALILKHLGPTISPTEEEWQEIENRDWKIIEDVFGEKFRIIKQLNLISEEAS